MGNKLECESLSRELVIRSINGFLVMAVWKFEGNHWRQPFHACNICPIYVLLSLVASTLRVNYHSSFIFAIGLLASFKILHVGVLLVCYFCLVINSFPVQSFCAGAALFAFYLDIILTFPLVCRTVLYVTLTVSFWIMDIIWWRMDSIASFSCCSLLSCISKGFRAFMKWWSICLLNG